MITNVSLNENQITLLQKSMEDIHEIKDWDQLTQAIVLSSIKLAGGQKGLFLVFDQSLKQLIPHASIHMDKQEIREYISEARELFFQAENQKKRSLLINGIYYFPIFIQQEFAALLVITPDKAELLTPEQVHVMHFFMQSVPIVLENSRLYLMMQRKSKSLTYMNQLHQVINQYSFQEVLAEVVQKIGDFLHSEMAGIMLYDPDKNELSLQNPAFGCWQESIIDKYRVTLTEESNAKNVFMTGIPAITADATADLRFNQHFVDLFQAKTIITVPLVVDNKRIGIIHAINKKTGHFTQDDLKLLEEIATQLGGIFHAVLQMTTNGKVDYRRMEIERYLTSQLIEALISNGEEKLEEAERILHTLEYALEPRHCFLSLGIFEKNSWQKQLVKENVKLFRQHVRKYFPQGLSLYKEGTLILLVPHTEITDVLRTAKHLQLEVTKALQGRVENDRLHVYIGIGESVSTIKKASISYQQSSQILHVLPRIPHIGHVGYFPFCGSWTLLSSLTLQEELVQSYTNLYLSQLNHLRDAAEIKQTLEMFLKHNGHMKQTAEALFIHQNTLKYRIEKIEDSTGFNLSDSEVRLNLHLALRLEQLIAN